MRNLFNPDNPVLNFINSLVKSAWLNILWMVFCIPIITIGPATTALFYCCQKIPRQEDTHLTRSFIRSFKANFKQGMQIGVVLTLLAVVLAVDGYALRRLYNTSVFWAILTAVFVVACLAVLIIAMWIFPLLARFDNSNLAMVKNSLMLGMRFLICSALMAGIYFIMLCIVINVMTPAIVFGFGTCAYLCTLLQKGIFYQLEGPGPEDPWEVKADEDEEEEE